MAKLALQADLCYNMSSNIVVPEDAINTFRTLLAHLDWRCTMDILSSNDPQRKRCTGPCGRTLPATLEYFHAAKKGKYGLFAKCKECRMAYQHQPEVQEHKQAYDKIYRSQPEVQERHKAYGKAYRTNPETRESLLAQKRAYDKRSDVKAHRKEYRSRPEVRERRRNQRETNAGYYKAYRERNREHRQAYNKAYKSRPEIQEHDRVRNSAYYKRPERQERLQVWKQEYLKRPRVREQIRAKCRNRRARKRSAPGFHTPIQIREQYDRQKGKCHYCRNKVEWGKHHVDHVVPLSRGGSNDISNLVIACPTCNWKKNNKLPHEWPEGGRLL